MLENDHQKSAQNYELLIRLDEQMKGLTKEVRDMHTSVDNRVAILEETRMTKEAATEKFTEIFKITDSHTSSIAVLKTQATEIKTMIKVWGCVIGGAVVVLQIIIAIVKP